jgi:hypothetical protein
LLAARLIISDSFPKLRITWHGVDIVLPVCGVAPKPPNAGQPPSPIARRFNSSPTKERVMKHATSTLIAAVAALTLSGVACAQNNTLATPTTKSPADTSSGYGTPGATQSESGTWSPNSEQPNQMDTGATSVTPAYGGNNTLATPTTKSPAAPK